MVHIPQTQSYATLTQLEQQLVDMAWKMAAMAHCPFSNFPVGAALVARNKDGEEKIFGGNNIEISNWGGSLCAERVAAFKAVSEGFKTIICTAVVCSSKPSGSPCGFCRQVLRDFGKDSTILTVLDEDNTVRKWQMEELLPDSFGPESL